MTLAERWNRHWFTATDRYHYGIARIALLGGLLLLEVIGALGYRTNIAASARTSDAFTSPTLLVRVLHLPLPIPHWRLLLVLLAVLTVMGIVGVWTRAALVGVALLNLYLGSAINSYGFIDHATTLPALALLVLAAAPGATALSYDRWRRRREGGEDWTGWHTSWAAWPAALLLVLLALTYGSSGYAKLHESGLRWADGQTLESYLGDPQPDPYFLADPHLAPGDTFRDGIGIKSFLYSTGYPTATARDLARFPMLVTLISAAAMLWELTFPVVLFVRKALPWYLLGGVAFHATVWFTLGLRSFASYLLVYVVFIDWKALARLATSGRAVAAARAT
jgi:hypothetical protein